MDWVQVHKKRKKSETKSSPNNSSFFTTSSSSSSSSSTRKAMVTPKVSRSLILISSTSNLFDQQTAQHDHIKCRPDGVHHEKEIEQSYQYHTPHTSINPQVNQQIFIGNLKHDMEDITLVRKLQQLFKDSVDLEIPEFRFTIFQRDSKKHPRKYGYLNLATLRDEEKAYKLDGLTNLDFVIEGLALNVNKRLSTRNRVTKWNKLTFNGRRRLVNRSRSDTDVQADDKSNLKAQSSKRELMYGQNLPSEDRVTEYKKGGGNYLRCTLIQHVRKYVCAFLNSEGGRLMIGVDDTCKVFGVSCTRKQEDLARCQIDNTIKQFQPHVAPHMYMVEFIPVRLVPHDNVEFDCIDPLLKVLKISVVRQNMMAATLYVNDKENIFLRRDGSVEGPLKIPQIIEWCRTQFSQNNIPHNDQDTPALLSHSNSVNFEKILDQLSKRQNEVLAQMEESFHSASMELQEKIKLLQVVINTKENQVTQITQNLFDALKRLEQERKRQKHRTDYMCTIC
ncbi:uncharacterized protein [Clytia hemisphaerica]|uniref:Schlafen AlbA-2 domain-containing protein n=1 Tax=Clytia hemisphaerica TaxID=252671 RepID=A0A7M5UTN2_9CNID|eukprot:TCONS_00018500-protein